MIIIPGSVDLIGGEGFSDAMVEVRPSRSRVEQACDRVWRGARCLLVLPLILDGCRFAGRALAKRAILNAPSAKFLASGQMEVWRRFFAQDERQDDWMKLSDTFEFSGKEIPIGDGKMVDGFVFRDRRPGPKAPTIVMVQGNGMSYQIGVEVWRFLYWAKASRTRVNIVVYDHPGVGRSMGPIFRTDRDLSRVARAVVAFAETELSTPSHEVMLYGRSLGGAISAMAAAELNEEGKRLKALILDRSPTSMREVVKAHTGPRTEWVFRGCLEGLNFDVKRALSQLDGENIWMLHNIQDRIVPPAASVGCLEDLGRIFHVGPIGEIAREDLHNTSILDFQIGGAPVAEIFKRILAPPPISAAEAASREEEKSSPL